MEALVDLFYAERYCAYRNVAALVGVLFVAKVMLSELYVLAVGLRAYFLAPLGISRTNIRQYGKWAVVTGASEGIGRGYALELARRGLDVVIMSRSREKLDKVAQEITSKYKEREVRVFPVDFSKGQEVYPDIAEELRDLDIGILVNNVGLSSDPDYFANMPEKRLRDIVELNVQAMVQITRIILPLMEAKRKGVVVNLSSFAQEFCPPMFMVYSATKVFVNAFSDGLRKEYGDKGIIFQTVTPLVVVTSLSGSAGFTKTSFFNVRPEDFARAAINTIGIQKITRGCWPHALQAYIMMGLPRFLIDRMGKTAMLEMREKMIRKRAEELKNQ